MNTSHNENLLAPTASPPIPRTFLRLRDVARRIGLSRATIYRLISDGKFPKPVKLSERTSVWVESEVDAYCELRIARRNAAEIA